MHEPSRYFKVEATALIDRIDVGFQNPQYFFIIQELNKLSKSSNLKLDKLGKLLSDKDGLELTGGATPLGATYMEEGIPFIRVQNVRKNELVLNKVKFIPKFIHEGMLKRSQLKEGDVLLTITGMTYGLSATVPKDLEEANMNQHSVRMRIDKDKILPKYISYFLNSRLGKIQTDRYVTGSSRPALDYDAVRELYILYPIKSSEQEAIVGKCDALIDKAKEHREKYNSLVDEIRNITINEIGIPLSHKENPLFTTNKIDDRIDVKFNSPYLKQLKKKLKEKSYRELRKVLEIVGDIPIPFNDSYRLIELEDVDEDLGEVSSPRTVLDLGSQKVMLKKSELVISQLQPETAKIFLVNEKLEGCVGSSELIPLKLISDETTLLYLWCILRSPYVLKQWQSETTGSTRDRIGESELYDTIIPFPNEETQKRIVKETLEVIEKAKEQRKLYKENIKNSEKVFVENLEKAT